jgi:hypothetical protein
MQIINTLSDWLNDSYRALQLWLLVCVVVTTAVTGLTTVAGIISNARSSKALEDEKVKRVEMEEALAPRTIAISMPGMGDLLAPLKKFEGMQVEIRFAPDIETSRAAGQILFAVQQTNWKIIGFTRDEALGRQTSDGVRIEWYFPELPAREASPETTIEETEKLEAKSKGVAQAFAKFLSGEPNRWKKVRASWPRNRGELPPNTIRIKIGLKPSPFLPKELKEILDQDKKERHEERARMTKERNERRAQSKSKMLEQRKKQDEKNPPSATLLEWREAHDKEWDEREKEWDARDEELEKEEDQL